MASTIIDVAADLLTICLLLCEALVAITYIVVDPINASTMGATRVFGGGTVVDVHTLEGGFGHIKFTIRKALNLEVSCTTRAA
jgi:hypothetical protein